MNTQTWFLVMNPYPGGQKPVIRHKKFQDAQKEAERVSALTGKKIHVLKCVGTMYPSKPTWRYRSSMENED